jgi:hypothetical protein
MHGPAAVEREPQLSEGDSAGAGAGAVVVACRPGSRCEIRLLIGIARCASCCSRSEDPRPWFALLFLNRFETHVTLYISPVNCF